MTSTPTKTGVVTQEALQSLRDRVIKEIHDLSETRTEIRDRLKAMFGLPRPPSGMDACLLYLMSFLHQPIDTRELAAVSGIPTYARRLRQLRVEQGYEIVCERSSNITTYILEAATPNAARAALWKKRNSIRKIKGSAENRILEAFKQFVGNPLDIEDLAYVSKIATARERARDLRLHKGWRIFGKLTGRPDLKVTEYVLESTEQLPLHDRQIPDILYDSILERDGRRCTKCGWNHEKRMQGARRQFLEVHHKKVHSKGGKHERDNLVTLCNIDHDEVHRLKLDEETIDAWLES